MQLSLNPLFIYRHGVVATGHDCMEKRIYDLPLKFMPLSLSKEGQQPAVDNTGVNPSSLETDMTML